MTSRLRWFGLGMAAGSIAALKVERRIRERIRQASPTSLLRRAGELTAALGTDLKASVDGGVRVMKEEMTILKESPKVIVGEGHESPRATQRASYRPSRAQISSSSGRVR